MPKTCNVIDCPLDSESGDTMCVIHSRRDGKRRDDLLPAFAELDRQGVIRVHRAYLRDADMSGLCLSQKNLRLLTQALACKDRAKAKLEVSPIRVCSEQR